MWRCSPHKQNAAAGRKGLVATGEGNPATRCHVCYTPGHAANARRSKLKEQRTNVGESEMKVCQERSPPHPVDGEGKRNQGAVMSAKLSTL